MMNKLISLFGFKLLSKFIDGMPVDCDEIVLQSDNTINLYKSDKTLIWDESTLTWCLANKRYYPKTNNGVYSTNDIHIIIEAWKFVIEHGGLHNASVKLSSLNPKTNLHVYLNNAINIYKRHAKPSADNIVDKNSAYMHVSIGHIVQYSCGDNTWYKLDIDSEPPIGEIKYRLYVSDAVFKINGVTLPKPFIPTKGDSGYVISAKANVGYEHITVYNDNYKCKLGMWEKESDIIKVIEALTNAITFE